MTTKKISIINMKGGVGKTTLSIHLSYYLAKHKNQKVLLIDLDPQANATLVAIEENDLIDHYKQKKTIFDLFFNWMQQYGPFTKTDLPKIKIQDCIYTSYASSGRQAYLHVIPSHIELSSMLRGANVGPYELEKLLSEQAEGHYDFIIIDCAPTYSILTTLALNSSKQVLIPMVAEPFGVHGTKLMKLVLDEHEYDYGFKVKIAGVVFTMWKTAKPSGYALTAEQKIKKEWGTTYVFNQKISNDENYKIINGKNFEGENGNIDVMKSGLHQSKKDEFVYFVDELLQQVV
jgi:chromosome partitioning protein